MGCDGNLRHAVGRSNRAAVEAAIRVKSGGEAVESFRLVYPRRLT
jgi:hypothetical protein